jgi:hypothetical protein
MERHLVAIVDSQTEYWEREFGSRIILKKKDFKEALIKEIDLGNIPIVQIDNNAEEFDFLLTLPRASIIGWLPSDETASLTNAKRISEINAFKLLLTPYSLNKSRIQNLFLSSAYFYSNLRFLKSIQDFIKLILWSIRGLKMSFRQQKTRALYQKSNLPFYNFPLGYTDVFCKSFLNFLGKKDDSVGMSLLNSDFFQPLNFRSNIVFVGQEGQVVRQVAINAAEADCDSKIVRRSGYGAGEFSEDSVKRNGREYINLLIESKYVLCPPGNISGNSFRIHETVIVRRIPLVFSHVLSDPNFISSMEIVSSYKIKQSWGKLIAEAKNISDLRYEELIQSNYFKLKTELQSAKKIIELNLI